MIKLILYYNTAGYCQFSLITKTGQQVSSAAKTPLVILFYFDL